MKWILWREYRLNRPILIAGAVLLLLPYLVVLIALWLRIYSGPIMDGQYALSALISATSLSLVLSQLTVALLGGNAIAGERADRSAEFIVYLPLSRVRLLAGKLILASSAAIVIWGTNLLILYIILRGPFPFNQLARGPNPHALLMSYSAITGLAFYGVAWLISSLQSSPTFAFAGGLVTPLLIGMGLGVVGGFFGVQLCFPHFVETAYAVICTALGIQCFAIGTWYYLRRVEP